MPTVRFLVVALIGVVGCREAEQPAADTGADGAETLDAVAETSEVATVSADSDASELAETGPETLGTLDDVAWAPCPLYVDQPDGPMAECATVDLPLRWDAPEGSPKLGIFIQRRKALSGRRGQLWLLEGGPGGPGADFDTFMESFQALDPTLDLIAVDHRGVGRSSRLGCPAEDDASPSGFGIEDAEWPECIAAIKAQWGDDLDEFTTTAAARDLSRLIDDTRQPGDQVFVYGVSYGTFWAQRYLQVAPGQATGVILDSIVPPDENFWNYDADFNQVGQALMVACGADTACARKLGPGPDGPWRALEAAYQVLDTGACPGLADTMDRDVLRYLLGALLMSVETRVFIPAVAYRINRCEPGDVAALKLIEDRIFGAPGATGGATGVGAGTAVGPGPESYYDALNSTVAFYQIAFPELMPAEGPNYADALQAVGRLSVATSLTPSLALLEDSWPRYPRDAFMGQWASAETPLLMMNGDLDPQTPIWVGAEAKTHFTGPHQTFVTVPLSAHCAMTQSPVKTPGAQTCGMQILLSFLAAPEGTPDTSCLSDLAPLDFASIPEYVTYLFGTADIWENAPAPGPAATMREAPPKLARALRQIRQGLHRH